MARCHELNWAVDGFKDRFPSLGFGMIDLHILGGVSNRVAVFYWLAKFNKVLIGILTRILDGGWLIVGWLTWCLETVSGVKSLTGGLSSQYRLKKKKKIEDFSIFWKINCHVVYTYILIEINLKGKILNIGELLKDNWIFNLSLISVQLFFVSLFFHSSMNKTDKSWNKNNNFWKLLYIITLTFLSYHYIFYNSSTKLILQIIDILILTIHYY